MSPLNARGAVARLERAPTVSGEARRIVGELRRAGGSLRIGELGTRSAHDLARWLRELRALGLVELVGPDGEPWNVDAVALMLRGGGTRERARRDVTVRLAPGAEGVALRVASDL